MIIALECVYDTAYNCYQTAIVTVANLYKRDYQMMAMGKWCFHYESEKEERIGNKLEPYYGRDIVGHSFFHGINLNIYKENKNKNRDIIIRLLQENKPILIHCDIFTCRWNMAYGKYHVPHFYIIYGYLEDSGNFICMDPYLNEKYIECDCMEIFDGIIDFRVMTLKKELHLDEYIFKTELLNDVKFYEVDNTYENINQFAYEIEEYMNLDEEIKGFEKDLFAVPLLDNLRIINMNRKSYIKMLEYINDLTNLKLEKIMDKAKICTNEWEYIRVLLIKMIMTREKNILERVVMKINNVNQNERQMFQMLNNCCHGL